MALSFSPIFTQTPRMTTGLVNTANTNTDGTSGSRVDIFVAGSNGSRCDSVQIKGIVAEGATQAADTVRIWLNNGSSAFLLKEQLIPAGGGVVSATVANAEYSLAMGFDVPTGSKLQASTHGGGSTASYHVTGIGGDY
jgi:hypothetical protein